jgi:hypothetical protein
MDEHALTDEQREDLRRLRHYIEREDLRRIMNNTKWREAIAVVRALQPEFWVQFRARWVSQRSQPTWEGSFPWHLPSPWLGIEWLDIKTVVTVPRRPGQETYTVDRTDEILSGFRSCNVPFTYADGVVRIWGYLRPGETVVLDGA